MSYAETFLGLVAFIAAIAVIRFMIRRKDRENPETVLPDERPTTKGGGGGPQEPL